MKVLKKERTALENTAEKLLSLALNAGAEKAEVCAGYGQKTRISLEKQDYHMASSDDGFQFGLRVLKAGKQGFSSCNTTDPRELKEMALRAIEIAGFSPVNPYLDVLPSENVPNEAPADLFDPALHQVSLQTQRDWTKLLVDEALKDKRFRLNEGSLEIASGLFLVMSSLGTHKIEKETAAAWSLMGMGMDGERLTSFDYFSALSRKAQGTPDRLVATARRFRELVLENLNQTRGESYKGVVVFTPRAAVEIFLGSLAYHFNGRNLVEGTTRWKPEERGRDLFHKDISLYDNPWLTDRTGCAIFDREGTPTKPLTLVEGGRWRAAMLDHYAAKALGETSTGHGVGGPSAAPTVGTHCLCLGGGREPRDELLKRVAGQQKAFLIVHRYSGQVDPVTGDFSGVAKGGEWWTGGHRVGFVQETLISGNLFQSLEKALFGLSKETEVVDAGEEAPWLAVDGISVTAGGKDAK